MNSPTGCACGQVRANAVVANFSITVDSGDSSLTPSGETKTK